MARRGSQQINAGLTDLLELQITLAAMTARLLDDAGLVTVVDYADAVNQAARVTPDGPVRRILESLAVGVGPELPPRFEVIDGGKD